MYSPEYGYFSAEKFLPLAPSHSASLLQTHAAAGFAGEIGWEKDGRRPSKAQHPSLVVGKEK
ncbi:hypothetical protein A2853_02895 [Candidatus Kaiserbacteria bacterium RIFCSPHIGHO2_01_FULL_55_17]|uniref:Uncharacterized protein n=1 Tax=Candidatus Kaiserbacteria bacterium RIFCSPHIGHO2_01_FULL_55_17 TaxID=1798484 RepID=A0A1F6DCB1_9BACT|nr:MAG: hypothetical protein A2853_02895 [Candidatus Kaiserbacteria bacterium RIFCSPHIGHO2_01_FULL_55_17]